MLKAEDFKSPLDSWSPASYAEEQYQAGLKLAQQGAEIHIAINGVWSARMPDGAHISSYEKLGYHGRTSNLVQGWIDGGATIIDHRG